MILSWFILNTSLFLLGVAAMYAVLGFFIIGVMVSGIAALTKGEL